jgi:hypothetical protein
MVASSVFLAWIIGNSIPFVHMNATKAYSYISQDLCAHLWVSPCPLLAKADGCTLGVSPKTVLFNTYCSGVDSYWLYLCVWQHKTNP